MLIYLEKLIKIIYMKKSLVRRFYLFASILYLIATFFSCSSTQKIKYFQDIPDSGQLKTIPSVTYSEPTIQVDDILTIYVQTVDPQSTSMINLSSMSVSSSAITGVPGAPPQAPSGYLVNKAGYIEMPVLGNIKVVGQTTSGARDLIRDMASKYFKDPTVIVRYANFKVDITGEVLRPGQYVLPSEKVTILDALAMAGDLTVFGKRENVLLIRENSDGTKTPYRINLKKSDIMYSPFYYLRQNDVIYVEPRKAKSDATDASQTKYITLAGALLSIILVLAYRVK